MDTPLTTAELFGEDDFRVRAIKIIDSMPLEQVPLVVDLLEVLAKHGIPK